MVFLCQILTNVVSPCRVETETKVVSTPEKKVVEEEKKVVEEVDDDSKSSENGAEPEVVKENGASVEKETEEVEAELPKNGDAKGSRDGFFVLLKLTV